MSQTNDSFWDAVLIIILAAPFILLLIAVFYKNMVAPFRRERAYIKMEIGRSHDDEEEYLYWKRELKKLYILHIPFVGRFIWKLIR